ncbi:MAG: M28 family peptidase [Thermoplasmatales archaeon]|nr:M28 family peptidase [Thermoplasmatales archaeon]
MSRMIGIFRGRNKTKYSLFRKGLALGIIFLFFGTAVLPGISSNIIEANVVNDDSEFEKNSSIINSSVLDLQYIYNLTENLSNIIFTEYNESAGEIAKGRAFGSKGEHKAADILFENMTKLGLYTKKERIKKVPRYPNITCKLDVLEKGLTIHDLYNQTNTTTNDFYIVPRFNFTGISVGMSFELQEKIDKNPILGSIIARLIPLFLPRPNRFLDRKYNLYCLNRLTYNFTYKNLEVKRKPTNYFLAEDLKRHKENQEPFVYISKDPSFTNFEFIPKTKYQGLIYKLISKLPQGEKILWTLFHPNCKGIIIYDSNSDSYNTGQQSFPALPTIRVNGTLGQKIADNPNNYRIDFYINQSWNESVESYNVIGQLNGTDPTKTIIVCSLYDSWWCQGTGDAAIGMAMVLGIAKYFVDHNITPKCNVKFIAFAGEEQGMRGPNYYEITHRDENILYVLDINQVGFIPIYPENLGFFIWTNNKCLIPVLEKFGEESQYTKRTGNVTRFTVLHKPEGGLSNVVSFAKADLYGKRSCDTICFIKTGYDVPGSKSKWLRHHKDGEGHTAGDVLDHFDWNDTSVTGELVLNVTKYFTVDPK